MLAIADPSFCYFLMALPLMMEVETVSKTWESNSIFTRLMGDSTPNQHRKIQNST
jgi:hypothetical protein